MARINPHRQTNSRREFIGLLLDPTPNLLVGMLAVLKSGRAFVLISPEFPIERICYVINDCSIKILVTEERYLSKLDEISERCDLSIHAICLEGAEKRPEMVRVKPTDSAMFLKRAPFDQTPIVDPEQPAYVVYTSGSTGMPKGVLISHRNLTPMLLWSKDYFDLGEQTKVLQNLSPNFDFGIYEILTTILFGGTLYFPDQKAILDVSMFVDLVKNHSINTLHTTPLFCAEIMSYVNELGRLKIVHLGGEPLTGALVNQIFNRVSDECVIYNGYGPTEATVNSSIFRVGRKGDYDVKLDPNIPIGSESANNLLYILDKNYQLVPFGILGELYVGGGGLSEGYLNRPDLTAERFIPDTVIKSAGARMYATGDLVRRRRDGNIEFLGRVDRQVKIRGIRIEPEEVEANLKQLPLVRECIVTAYEDKNGDKRLVAYIATQEGGKADVGELRRYLLNKLPDHFVPSSFMFLSKLPIGPNGKLDGQSLPAPDFESPEPQRPNERARDAVETLIANICADVLGVKDIGIFDNFFELGCNSILSTRILSRLREAFRIELPLSVLFENPTVAGLAEKAKKESMADQNLWLPPIETISRDAPLPLSFSQERLWFLSQLEPDSVSYHVPRAIRVAGPLGVISMQNAINELIRRHEILRTTFPIVDNRPVQAIHRPETLPLPIVDLSLLAIPVREAYAKRLIHQESRRPFDLGRGPMIRLVLLRFDSREYILMLTEHHMIHDGWTQGVLLRDLLTIFKDASKGMPSSLTELSTQYADFAYWQRKWLQGEVLETQLSYWKKQLAGAPPVIDLPTDLSRPGVRSSRGAEQSITLSGLLSQSIRALCRSESVTLFMAMLAAFKILLYRYSGQEDIIVGSAIANRRHREIEGLLGVILNNIVLRTSLSGSPTFRELLGSVRKVCLDAYAYQDFPFEKAVEALQPKRSLSHTPLFQVMFSFMDIPQLELEIPGLILSEIDAHNRSAKFDLSIVVLPHADQRMGRTFVTGADEITVIMEYNTDIFNHTTITRILKHYKTLLAGMPRNLNADVDELPLLDEIDKHELLIERQDTKTIRIEEKCFQQLFEEQAEKTPDAIAASIENEQITYRETNSRSNRLARYLQRVGCGPDVIVGICVERSLKLVELALAILKAGGAFVPLDPTYPADRLSYMIENSRLSILLTTTNLRGRLPKTEALVALLDIIEEEVSAEPDGNSSCFVNADNLAYVIYTSGSTGQPKGVMIQRRGLSNLARAQVSVWGDSPDRRILQFASFSYDAFIFELVMALSTGGRLCLGLSDSLRGDSLMRMLVKHAITHVILPPSLLSVLPEWELPALKTIIAAGEECTLDIVKKWAKSRKFFNAYGPTEATVWTAVTACEGGDEKPSIGRPVANVQSYILNRKLQVAPINARAGIYIGGPGLARGYLNNPDITAERFIPNPFSDVPGSRLYESGDIGRIKNNGNIEFISRSDQQVKISGIRIELGEIEATLKQHPSVQNSVVTIQEDANGARQLVAYLVFNGAQSVTIRDVRVFLQKKLPGHMIPSIFLEIESFSLLPSGKVDRSLLPEPIRSRSHLNMFVAPRSQLEQLLSQTLAEMLNIERVGIYDNFFELGIHSLLAIRIMFKLSEVLGVDITLQSLFEHPTVAELSQAIEGATQCFNEVRKPILPVSREKYLAGAYLE